MYLSDEFILELTQAQQRLFGYIYRRVANREQAQEVLQQTNLVLCRKANEFEPDTNFNAWAVAVAHYQILSHRANVTRERLVFSDEVFAVVDDRDEESLIREKYKRILRFCYGKLSQVNQELMKLRYQEGLSFQQVADELNKKISAVKVQVHRIRLNLKKCAQEQLKEQQL
ncbi:MAG: sigma-70 family RNA polymerase sigma factor [Verrucomicrobiota bacterium]|nr:sigma-70 family RNA polymerase sigma factor [Verrucomicrobiota bacterium]